MNDQVTTTVRLSKAQLKRLKLRALQEERSVAEIIRDGIGLYLDSKSTPSKRCEDDAFFTMGPYGVSDVDDLSVNHDKYLHGWGDQD